MGFCVALGPASLSLWCGPSPPPAGDRLVESLMFPHASSPWEARQRHHLLCYASLCFVAKPLPTEN